VPFDQPPSSESHGDFDLHFLEVELCGAVFKTEAGRVVTLLDLGAVVEVGR